MIFEIIIIICMSGKEKSLMVNMTNNFCFSTLAKLIATESCKTSMQLQKGKFAMQTLLSKHRYLVPSQGPSLCCCHVPVSFKWLFIEFHTFAVFRGFSYFRLFVG